MEKRKLGPFEVSAIGLGCMSMSHAYGVPDRAMAEQTLHGALDAGYNFLDTAALYGFGNNERLIGEVLQQRRREYVLASKCGLIKGPDGQRAVNGRPAAIRETCEASLRNLRTDIIDLYYLHRVDPQVPVEESVGALADLKAEGKILSIGLSEVAVPTLQRAFNEHPIAALQSEYSLWTRNPEPHVLNACKDLGITFVAFSPLGRGFLCNTIRDPAQLVDSDLRRTMPRFQGENFSANLALLDDLCAIAEDLDCSPAQLALAWVLNCADHIVPIPGTQNRAHMEENARALSIRVSAGDLHRLDQLFDPQAIHGDRYNQETMATMET